MGFPMGQFHVEGKQNSAFFALLCTGQQVAVTGLPAQKNRAFPDFFDEKMHKSGARGRFA